MRIILVLLLAPLLWISVPEAKASTEVGAPKYTTEFRRCACPTYP